ncbi:hypothetical protein GP486_003961 [Trichoglossum hirsutum]|uniref:Uncharacterized protein n=1 Tax=Trichoglossum hirsutum TaxID=265104 RepID=A0A9P8LC90_9PEZI|nr:hypothetical protein GP486_003961 [Trichoglossum hirsutum]
MQPSEPLPDLASLSLNTQEDFFLPWVLRNGFTHDLTAPPAAEFDRLVEHMKWVRGSKGYLKWHKAFLEWDKNSNPPLLPLSLGSSGSNGGDGDLAGSSQRSRHFFDKFQSEGFAPDPTAPLVVEFKRLARSQGWGKDSNQYKEQRAVCYVAEFEAHYGNKSERLEGWQSLCREVHITPVPTSISKCKKELRKVWVNIVDLIDCRRTGQRVTLHSSRNALRKYSKKHGKIFSLKAAKNNGFLAALLIQMF